MKAFYLDEIKQCANCRHIALSKATNGQRYSNGLEEMIPLQFTFTDFHCSLVVHLSVRSLLCYRQYLLKICCTLFCLVQVIIDEAI